ncbi:MAG: iron-containing alcohol dehydrogenase [Rickettsiales bacterium]|nr:iron-containing alcohol dehydrogenase [Rickettsiales bacterium]
MTQKAKPDFANYGITLAKVGDNCGDLLLAAHSGNLHFVGDANTITAAKALLPAGATIMEFPEPPKADDKTVELVRQHTASADVLIAVGSGTLNDLCKYASSLESKPYSVIATAPSMNGYVSGNASITVDGYKKTLTAHAPTTVICDLDILNTAPKRLIQAGIGDTLCRSTVQADWLLSHLILDTPYEPLYFEWMADSENRLLDNPDDDRALIEALLLSGIAMRECGSSAPASQAEHMIAHTMEMLHPNLPHSYHGEHISITSLTMAKRQEALLAKNSVSIGELDGFGNLPLSLHKQAQKQFYAKLPDSEKVATLSTKLANEWPTIAAEIRKVLLPSDRLQEVLETAGCPVNSEAIGWAATKYQNAITLARFTRDRFTFLDLI